MKMCRVGAFWIICLGVASASACERGAPAPRGSEHDHANHHHQPAEAPPASEEPYVPVGPSIETGSFLLALAPAESGYRVGKASDLQIELEGRGKWHVNQEYPIRVDLKGAPGVALKTAELGKDDAKEFSEEKVRFVVAVEPTAPGAHDVTCEVSFAMCTEENCILENRTVSTQLKVE